MSDFVSFTLIPSNHFPVFLQQLLLAYEQKLTQLDLITLEERRVRDDMIDTFKILRGFDKVGDGNSLDRTLKPASGDERIHYETDTAVPLDHHEEQIVQFKNCGQMEQLR